MIICIKDGKRDRLAQMYWTDGDTLMIERNKARRIMTHTVMGEELVILFNNDEPIRLHRRIATAVGNIIEKAIRGKLK